MHKTLSKCALLSVHHTLWPSAMTGNTRETERENGCKNENGTKRRSSV